MMTTTMDGRDADDDGDDDADNDGDDEADGDGDGGDADGDDDDEDNDDEDDSGGDKGLLVIVSLLWRCARSDHLKHTQTTLNTLKPS